MPLENKINKWIHINFFFKYHIHTQEFFYLNLKEFGEFRRFLAKIIKDLGSLIDRKFYLFEDFPHLFLALELKSPKNLKKIERYIDNLKKHKLSFINHFDIFENTRDEKNGEDFLNVMNVFTDRLLFVKAKNRHDIDHLFHCVLNQMGYTHLDELKVYRNMVKNYNYWKNFYNKWANRFKDILFGYNKDEKLLFL